MIQVTPQMKLYIALAPIDFRKGIDGIASICRLKLEKNPFSGAMFIFRNKSRTTLKLLVYDGQGFWLCTKRLSKGKFKWWASNESVYNKIQANELQVLLYNGYPNKASMSPEWKKVNEV